MIKMTTNIVLCLLICVTSVSPNSSPNMPSTLQTKNTEIYFVPSNSIHYSNIQHQRNSLLSSLTMLRKRRHTPFLPGDHWNGLRPDFGPTETDIEVMVNGTARMKCPITHVSDNRVSTFVCFLILN